MELIFSSLFSPAVGLGGAIANIFFSISCFGVALGGMIATFMNTQ